MSKEMRMNKSLVVIGVTGAMALAVSVGLGKDKAAKNKEVIYASSETATDKEKVSRCDHGCVVG